MMTQLPSALMHRPRRPGGRRRYETFRCYGAFDVPMVPRRAFTLFESLAPCPMQSKVRVSETEALLCTDSTGRTLFRSLGISCSFEASLGQVVCFSENKKGGPKSALGLVLALFKGKDGEAKAQVKGGR